MPLFICSECGVVENSHLVNKSRKETRYNYNNRIPGEMEPKFYPYMDSHKNNKLQSNYFRYNRILASSSGFAFIFSKMVDSFGKLIL